MNLVKYCSSSYNIEKGAKLQLGTLFYYQNIENKELMDEKEGSHELTINFTEDVELDIATANLLFQGFAFGESPKTQFEGSYETIANHAKFSCFKDKVRIEKASIKIKRKINNCLMFCMSHIDEGLPPVIFGCHNDYWSLPIEKAELFGKCVSRLILDNALFTAFGISPYEFQTIDKLRLRIQHQKVIYKERNIDINQLNTPSYDELVQLIKEIIFIKPLSYSNEREYRFIFELISPQQIYLPKVEKLLINSETLRKFTMGSYR